LTLSDRYEIAILLSKKYSYRDIAEAIGKTVSTIFDEIKRNSKKNGEYKPKLAHQKAYVRRKNASFKGKKIVKDESLRKFVEDNLLADKTPESIAGRLKKQEKELPYASRDTIYKYQQSPYGKILGIKKKKKKRKYGYKSKKKLKDRKFIEKRPKVVDLRQRVGDVEADFIVSGKQGKGILLVVVDRKLRVSFLEIIHKVTIKNVHKSFLKIQDRFPEIITLTLDNDILFRQHKYLEALLEIPIYFCRPYHSWEKGTVENTNKYIRKYIPKGSDLSRYDEHEISTIEEVLNSRFMKCLDYKTPLEILNEYREKQKTTGVSCCE
jgi:IS30 family transposase